MFERVNRVPYILFSIFVKLKVLYLSVYDTIENIHWIEREMPSASVHFGSDVGLSLHMRSFLIGGNHDSSDMTVMRSTLFLDIRYVR